MDPSNTQDPIFSMMAFLPSIAADDEEERLPLLDVMALTADEDISLCDL